MELWKHQITAVQRAKEMDYFGLFFDCGTGKSATAIKILEDKFLLNRDILKTLIICPVIVVEQWANEIAKFSNIPKERVVPLFGTGTEKALTFKLKPFENSIAITNYESLYTGNLYTQLCKWRPDALVIDECFVPGTKVETPNGEKSIELIKPGDYIINAFGECLVSGTSRHLKDKTVFLKFNNKTIECSENHPWLTSGGWVFAKNLKTGDLLAKTESAMRMVQCDTPQQKESILWNELFCEVEDVSALIFKESFHKGESKENIKNTYWNKETIRKSQNAYRQSDEKHEKSKEDAGNAQANWAHHQDSRWKWNGSDKDRENADRYSRQGMEVEPRDWAWNLEKGIPNQLQSGFGTHKNDDCRRGGRDFTHDQERPGYKENNETEFFRVESVEIQKCTSFGRSRKRDFYDLSVSKHPSFSVNGCVAHNSHKIKSHNSKRTKCIVNISINARYRFILSGTPVLNSPMDLFAQMLALDHGRRLGNNYYRFLYHYFFDCNSKRKGQPGYFPHWKPRPDTNANLNSIISDCTMRVRKEEVLDLPPLIKKEIHVGMAADQGKLYKELKKDFVAYLNDKAVVADLAITKALRLQQIASGFCVFDDGTLKSFDKTPRLEALKELLEEITPSNKVIIWAVFKHNYAQIREVCNSLSIKYAELHGEEKDKSGNIEKFKTDPDCRVLIGHPGSGGIGVNLVNASYSIFYSRNFSLEFDIQAEARNYRGGSLEAGHKSITRIDLVAKDTIDDTISKAISLKKSQSEQIVDGFGFSNQDILKILQEGTK